jgi:ribonucleoside-diphosphate reductase alpha chain
MRVTKRSGRVEDVKFDNVTNRISKLTEGLSNSVDVTKVAQQVFSSIYDGINTHEIDTLSAEICIGMITSDPDYEILATRITASNIQKRAANNFHIAMRKLHKAGIVTHEVLEVSSKVKDDIKPERDYDFGYFGLKTLEKGYLQKIDGEIIETPQYMYMRVAIGIHGHDTERVLETYDALSKGLFIHATPTLFNAGTPRPQMSSCFVAGTAVFTTNRGPVPIEEVCIGDNVVTHTGSIKPVLQTHKNLLGDRTLFDVKIYKTPGFQVTGNHRFWSITKEQLHWKDEPQWNSIEHLRVGDWISIPKTNLNTVYEILDMYELLKDENGAEHWTYSFEFDGTKMRRLTHFTSEYRPNGITLKGEWFERYIKVDEDFAWFIGSWYGDGCITYQRSSAKSKRTPTHRGISFAQNPNNTTFIEKIEKIGCKYLGVHACISKSKKRNCLSISFNNSAIGNAFNILFGRWSSGKFLWPNMYSWNRNMVSAFIGGLVSTDGCCTLRGNVTVQLTNQPLIKSIFHLSRSVGLDTSLTVGSKPYKDRKQYIGRIQFPWIPEIMKWVYKHYDDNRLYKSERANTTLEIDGKIFLRINAKTRVKDNLPEFVYTLGVKDDHSYTVQGVIAENCFLIANKEDSIDGIYDTVKECARISKWAGGIGLHIHDVRANKSHIRGTNGTSDGIIPMLRVYNSTARYVNQAGRRKGSIAVYLEPWHADILDFLEIRLNQGDEEARCRDLFSAMWIPDLFMKRVESGGNWSLFCPDQAKGLSDVYGKEFEDLYEKYEAEGLARKVVPASEVWKAIIKSQSETGTPYMLYKDACNEKSNHKHVGTIKSSNLCVAPETKILTSKGQQIISELVDQDVEVWNGDEFSNVTIRQTGKNQKLLTVKTSKGLELRCTPYHKFWIVGHNEPIEAQNLEKGMKIIKHSLPVINHNTENMKYAYTHGLFCADGTTSSHGNPKRCLFKAKNNGFCMRHQKNLKDYEEDDDGTCQANSYSEQKFLDLYHVKKKLMKFIDYDYASNNDACNKIRLRLPKDIDEKYTVPTECSLESKLEWFAGLIDGDGCVTKHQGGRGISIQIGSIHYNFLNDVLLMLQTIGVNSRINLSRNESIKELPGGSYTCKKLWRLLIPSGGVDLLKTLGLNTRRVNINTENLPNRQALHFDKIVSVEDLGETSDTFCFNEPLKHRGIFNGILTGNCTEILEYTDKDETAVCNLASIALPKYVDVEKKEFNHEELHRVTKMVTRNLNKVIDKNFYPTENGERSNMRHRPIGIGVQGLADVFIMLRMSFGSEESRKLNRDIFETIYHASLESSCELAEMYGTYETFKGSPFSQGILQFDMWDRDPKFSGRYDWNAMRELVKKGTRNSLLLAPMPTASTSQILGNNECFEPYTTNIYLRRTLAGEFVVVNKHLVNDLKERGLWSKEMKDLMVKANGSVQNIIDIPDDLKELYKTVWEMSQKTIIDMAADRGVYIDQSQSMNLFVESPTLSKLSSMHMYAWKTGLKTGMYYLRSKAKARPIQFSLEAECAMCSA